MKNSLLLLCLVTTLSLNAQKGEMQKGAYSELINHATEQYNAVTITPNHRAPQAVTTLLQEGFDSTTLPSGWQSVDADADGHEWDPDWDGSFAYAGNSCIASASFLYLEGSLTPDNWLISPSVSIPSGSGNIVLEYYVKGQNPNALSENYSIYAIGNNNDTTLVYTEVINNGQWAVRSISLNAFKGRSVKIAFRHHNCTNQFWLMLDELHLYQNTQNEVVPNVEQIEFETIIGESRVSYFQIFTVGVTSNVQVQTAAPFMVSTNGSDFATTVSLPASGGDVYVCYMPTQAGSQQGNVAISATNATTVQVALIGTAFDCASRTSNFIENFDKNSTTIPCWKIIDGNGDDKTFDLIENNRDASKWIFYYRYSEVNPADDWLLSPSLNIRQGDSLHLTYSVMRSEYPESFSIWVVPDTVTQGNSIALLGNQVMATKVVNNTNDTTEVFDLTPYQGSAKRVAIHCESPKNRFVFTVRGLEVKNPNPRVDVKAIEQEHLIVYPNPTKDLIYFTEEASVVEVFNTIGQLMLQKRLASGIQSISLSGLDKIGRAHV